jgi:hypothetical protein
MTDNGYFIIIIILLGTSLPFVVYGLTRAACLAVYRTKMEYQKWVLREFDSRDDGKG